MVRGRKGRMRAEEKGTLCCDSWMIICPPIRTVCEEIPSSHVCTSIFTSLSGSIEDNNNRRISVPHPAFFLFPLFSSFFFFLLEGSTGASRRSLNPFEFMTRKKSIGIVPRDPPFLLSLESVTLQFHRLLPYFLCGSLLSTCLFDPATIDRREKEREMNEMMTK